MKILSKDNNYLYSFIFCAIVSLFFSYHLFFYNTRLSPVKLELNLNTKITRLFPQEWAFFNGEFRRAQVVLYKKNSANQFDRIDLHINAYSNAFGIKKQPQRILAELRYIKREVNDSLYVDTKWNYQLGILGTIPDFKVDVNNYFKAPLLCGEYLAVYQRMIPWAWLKSIDRIQMPSKVIRLNIQCK
jgi:antimicrobial peptide system SdpA family protein